MRQLELSIDSRLEDVLLFEESKAALRKCIPHMADMLEEQKAVYGFTLRRIAEYAKGAITGEQLSKLDEQLKQLVIMVDDNLIAGGAYDENYPKTKAGSEMIAGEIRHSIKPGKVWRDTEGKRIQAHGGAIFYEAGTYYWYGENKDRTDGKSHVWTWGIRAYASKDLYNWEDLGVIIPPELTDSQSGLYPEKHVDRPHILKCPNTEKYVCWIKQSGDEECFLILTADSFVGPYEIVRENYRPFDMMVGDFDIEADPESGKAYLYMDADHKGVIGMTLTEDYLSVEKEISRQYMNLNAPFCREGITLFGHGGRKYMLTSGMSGYVPNKSDAAVTERWEDPFESIGNPHENDESNASFNSQISEVFRVEGTDLLIAIADRWLPDYLLDGKKADMFERAIANHFDPEHYQITEEENKEYMNSPMLESADTSSAGYVWLPVMIENGKPVIRWYDEWKWEDFKSETDR